MAHLYRIFTMVALFVFASVAPQAVTVSVAVLAAFLFSRFWEAIAIGVMLDALYSAPEPRWFSFQFVYTVIIALLLVIVWRLKKTLRWYSIN